MERRKSERHPVLVDIEVARPGPGRCYGFADNISSEGMSIALDEGCIPEKQRSVILSFKTGTGSQAVFRKIVARIVRIEGSRLALRFSERDFISEAVIRDLVRHNGRPTPVAGRKGRKLSPVGNRSVQKY